MAKQQTSRAPKAPKTYAVTSPVADFTGTRFGVAFEKGRGSAPDLATARDLAAAGYSVTGLPDEDVPTLDPADESDRVDSLAGVDDETATALRKAGIETVAELAATDAVTLAAAIKVEIEVADALVTSAIAEVAADRTPVATTTRGEA